MEGKTDLAGQIAAHSNYVRSVARRFVADPYLSEDLAQDAILVALQHTHQFDGHNLKGWLYRIVHNVFVTQYHREKKHQVLVDGWEGLQDAGLLSNSAPNEALYHFTEADLTRVVGNLPLPLAPAALLRMRNYKYEEIAHVLKIPVGTVRNRLFRARAALPSREVF